MRITILLILIIIVFTVNGQDSVITNYFNRVNEMIGMTGSDSITMEPFLCDIDSLITSNSLCNKSLNEAQIRKVNANTLIFTLNNDRTIKISKTPFNKNNHFIQYYKSYVLYIDSCVKFGVKFELPDYSLQTIEIISKNKKIQVPRSDIQNIYNPDFTVSKLKHNNTNNIRLFFDDQKILLSILGGDGSGAYQAIYVFSNDYYLGRVISIP